LHAACQKNQFAKKTVENIHRDWESKSIRSRPSITCSVFLCAGNTDG
jgi:hypothetical protein